MRTIFHLEPFPEFLHRCVELNRVHAPDDPVHAAMLAQDALRQAGHDLGEPDAATTEGRALQARRGLVALHREFPAAPAWEQAAFLLRGFLGLRPFPEANFRTGWDYTVGLLAHHGHSLVEERAEVEELRERLWADLEAAFPEGFRRADLLRRDATLLELAEWFRRRTAALPASARRA